MKRLITLSCVLFLLVQCGSREPTSENKRIIGTNNLTPVLETHQNAHLVQSIGMMERGCTVSHLGNGLAITAGHCLSHYAFVGTKRNLPCTNPKYSIRWGVTHNQDNTPVHSECVSILAIENSSERDYAFITVSPAPKHFLHMSLDPPPEPNSKIIIYSYPAGRALEHSGWCEYVPQAHESEPSPPLFFYNCDTEGGSSGAPVLNEQLQIIGIHNFYNGFLNLNGATLLTSDMIPKPS